MYSIISVGNAMYSVSTYGRAHNAAMRLGFNDDIDTYLLISSKHSFAEMIYSILIINFCVGAWTSSFFLGNFIGPSVAGFTVQHFGFAITTNGFVAAFVIMLLVNFMEWKQTYSRMQLI